MNAIKLKPRRFYSNYNCNGTSKVKVVCRTEKFRQAILDNNNNMSDLEFEEWFVGLIDGEGNFDITSNNLAKGYFAFRIRVKLHIDDLTLLKYVKERLNCGSIEISENAACLVFSKHSSLKDIILPIFDNFPLNSHKYLNYNDFKEAFYIYYSSINEGRKGLKRSERISKKVLSLKTNMNFNRTNFEMPINHSINITRYWLLGYIEGEGSFHLRVKEARAAFSLNVTQAESPLLLKIKEFLNKLDPVNNLFFDEGLQKPRGLIISRCGVNDFLKLKSNTHKPMSSLSTTQVDFFYKFFIPFLDKLTFLSKKKKDYLDWRLAVYVIYWNKHKTELGKSILFNLGKGMNNNRLSTNMLTYNVNCLETKFSDQINEIPFTIYIDNYGLKREISSNKLVKQRSLILAIPKEELTKDSTIKYLGQEYSLINFIKEVFKTRVLPSNFLFFNGITQCQDFFGLSNSKIQRMFIKNSIVKYNSISYHLFKFNIN